MKIIENTDGLFYWETVDGESVTSSMPFTKGQTKTRMVDEVEETYNVYDDLISQGYELVLVPQATKTAHEQAEARAGKLAELAALDVSPRTIEDALLGDEYALTKVREANTKKAELRKGL
jgi:hypothetical protein